MNHPAILVGNRTGGQGKTLISQMLHYGYSLAGVSMKAVAADTSAEAKKSKLGRILQSGVDELGTGARLSDIKENHHLAVQYWDRLGTYLRNGSSIIDLGANILPLVFDWAVERKAGRILVNSPVMLVVPITAQRQSMMDGLDMLRRSVEAKDHFPVQKRFAILNEYHGSFSGRGTPTEIVNLQRMEKDGQVTVISLRKCDCEVWERIEADFIPLAEMAELTFDSYVDRFGIDLFAASGAEASFAEWLSGSLKAFVSAGLVPPEVKKQDEGAKAKQTVQAVAAA
ncbi:hypothetical protein [Microvirga massiliensis]|uniref:hypothetical protein n=1 Tax=Microvirga massiliensis TaxID=1033741 RepID=UPI00062B4110|nr:hypothetical protein [Microvirga massiliensis]